MISSTEFIEAQALIDRLCQEVVYVTSHSDAKLAYNSPLYPFVIATMSQTANKSLSFQLLQYLVWLVLALIAFALILALALPIGFYGMAMYVSPKLPSVSEIQKANLEMPLQIYSKDNLLVGQYGNRMSLPITYDQIPEKQIQAFLAAEDASFYEHSGISIKGLGRAVTEVISDEGVQTGGSTITMQVAKNYFLTPERTFNRKLTELYLARKIESELTKQEILTLYVNKIYMGEGAYGVRAGAKKYFSKSLDKLSIAQMATLAGLPKAPSQNNPVENPEQAMIRRNWILGRMLYLGYITQAEHDKAIAEPMGLRVYREQLDANMPYLAEMTRQAMVTRFGEEVINSGWRVRLTVDSKVQTEAEQALEKGLISYDRRHGWRGVETSAKELLEEKGIEGGASLDDYVMFNNMYPAKVTEVGYRSFKAVLKDGTEVEVPWSGMRWAKLYLDANRISGYPGRASRLVAKDDIVRVTPNADKTAWVLNQVPNVQGSLVSLEPETGALTALVGGFDYKHSKFNRATQGWRQPGSTIKPLVYAAALEKGFRPDSTVSDRPLRVGEWKPKNSDGRFYGDMTLRRGLYLSRNLVSIRLLRSVGTADARHLLGQFGLDKDKLPTTLSLALGAGQATPLQMATAYATFANGGHRIQPYFIEQIYSYDNKLLYQANPQRACATCFNQDLEDTNKKLLEDYEQQSEAEANEREADLKTLQENPELLASINALIAEELAQEQAEQQDSEAATEALDASEDLQTGGSDETEETEAESETESKTKEAIPASEKTQRLKNLVYALRFNASPVSDRLKPTLINYNAANQAPRILKSGVTYEMADMLRDVIRMGTAKKAKALGRGDIGGKTGTTNEAKDAWFAGFHPSLVSVVWVGFDQPATLGRREYGGVAALPIWMEFMGEQLANKPAQWVSIDNVSKAEKEETEVIDITNDSIESEIDAEPQSKDINKAEDDDATALPTPSVTRRPLPPPPPRNNAISNRKLPTSRISRPNATSSSRAGSVNSQQSADSAPSRNTSNPLTVEKVDEMPELQ